MIIHYPLYYDKFKCIASDCKGSCCSAGWQISIDENTAGYYKKVPGEFGNRLKNNINFSNNKSEFKLLSNGRCPFLNDKNLCDIYTFLGPEHLCQICQDHPRFYNCFNSFTECGLGIYCEEACRIILTETTPFKITSKNTSEVISSNEYDEEIFSYLNDCRAQILGYINNNDISINSLVSNTLWFAHTIQQDIDSNLLDTEEIFPVSTDKKSNIEYFFNYLLTLEPNDKTWFSTLQSNIKIYSENASRLEEFYRTTPELNLYLKNLLYYFIYRYFLNSVFEEDVLSTYKFIALNIAILRALFFCSWIKNGKLQLSDCISIAKKYSEEIECCDDNIDSILTSCYDDMNFSTENILGLF